MLWRVIGLVGAFVLLVCGSVGAGFLLAKNYPAGELRSDVRRAVLGVNGVPWDVGDVEFPKATYRTMQRAAVEDIGYIPWDIPFRNDGGGVEAPSFNRKLSTFPMGSPMEAGGGCSAGFPVVYNKDGGLRSALVTAGHCAKKRNGMLYATDEGVPFIIRFDKPGDDAVDYSIFDISYGGWYNVRPRYDVDGVDNVSDQVSITGVAEPKVGDKVCSWGATSTWRCGSIVKVNSTTFWTDFMSRPGDSGGGVFAGGKVLGVTSAVKKYMSDGDVAAVTVVQRADVIMKENVTVAGGVE